MAGTSTTYSFADVVCSISFPSSGITIPSITGQGVGEITLTFPGVNTEQNLAADGSVMTTKILDDRGHITITLQQTALTNHLLTSAFNAQLLGLSAIWNTGSIIVTSPTLTLDSIACSNVAFEKRSDRGYTQQGGMWTWNFLCSNMQYLV